MTVKKDRINGIIMRELNDIIRTEVKNNKLGFLTITDVVVSNDMSVAKVYVSILGKGYEIKEGLEALEKSKGFIRSSLAKRMTIKKVPELRFTFDESLQHGNHINDIINKLNRNKD